MAPDPDPTPGPAELQATIEAMGRVLFPQGAILTSFVLITEWNDHDSEWWCHVATDDHAPMWRHQGLVAYAAEHDLCLDLDDDDDGD